VSAIGDKMVVIGRATRSGLGSMTADFCAEMQPERTVIIDVQNGMTMDLSPFRDPFVVALRDWRRSVDVAKELLAGMKWVVGFETFYCGHVTAVARAEGAQTVIFPNWEWSPDSVLLADMLICTSATDAAYYGPVTLNAAGHAWPITSSVITDKERNWPPRVFVHNAGTSPDRNNTKAVVSAARWLSGTDARLFVHSQVPLDMPEHDHVAFRGETSHRVHLYDEADVFVHPIGYGGLSLPIREAAANRIPTIIPELPEWSSWPYPVVMGDSYATKINRHVVRMHRPDIDHLGALMRSMALGEISRRLPPPPPTWDEFRAWWRARVMA
jgi:hypothetical protein